MKTKIAVIFWAICLMSLMVHYSTQAQNNESNQQALTMLRSFYTSYMNQFSLNDPRVITNNLKSIQKKYCIPSLLNKIAKADIDSDPFIKAQDGDVRSLKTLTDAKDPAGPDKYIVSWIYPTEKVRTTINLTVIKKVDGFKIASVVF